MAGNGQASCVRKVGTDGEGSVGEGARSSSELARPDNGRSDMAGSEKGRSKMPSEPLWILSESEKGDGRTCEFCECCDR
jgi:hypothetical protein